MITPRFSVDQEENYVVVTMKTPYIKSETAEFDICGCEFRFHAKPFFLRLCFPHGLKEDGTELATYDIDSGTFTVRLPKENPGQHFENLDLLTLLAPKSSQKASSNLGKGPLIEVLPSDENGESQSLGDETQELIWDIEQNLPEEPSVQDIMRQSRYGFNRQKSGVFSNLSEDQISEICLLPTPDSMTETERRDHRIKAEDIKFDAEHYMHLNCA